MGIQREIRQVHVLSLVWWEKQTNKQKNKNVVKEIAGNI